MAVLLSAVCLMVILVRQTPHTPIETFDTSYPDSDYSTSLLPTGSIYVSSTTCVYYWLVITDQYRSRNPSVKYDTSMCLTLLLVIGGIETNPGPRPPKYPCAICDKACRWGQKALACDECDHWYHAACTGIDSTEYSHLANTSVSWFCVVCNAPNHSTVLYDLIDSADSNTYSVLSVDKDSTGDLSRVSVSSLSSTIGDPLASSSPKRKDEQPKAKHQAKRTQKNLRVLVMNFQSVKNKRNDLQVMIESSHPDINIRDRNVVERQSKHQ